MSKFAIRRYAKARAGAVIVIEKKSGKRVYIGNLVTDKMTHPSVIMYVCI